MVEFEQIIIIILLLRENGFLSVLAWGGESEVKVCVFTVSGTGEDADVVFEDVFVDDFYLLMICVIISFCGVDSGGRFYPLGGWSGTSYL